MGNERSTGKYYEEQAANLLTTKGYQMIYKNFYYHSTEIDLIMLSPENILTFVEVKFRRLAKAGKTFIHPFFAIDAKKQQYLTQAAQGFLAQYPEYQNNYCRYDVVAFIKEPMPTTPGKPTLRVEHLENAFQIS